MSAFLTCLQALEQHLSTLHPEMLYLVDMELSAFFFVICLALLHCMTHSMLILLLAITTSMVWFLTSFTLFLMIMFGFEIYSTIRPLVALTPVFSLLLFFLCLLFHIWHDRNKKRKVYPIVDEKYDP